MRPDITLGDQRARATVRRTIRDRGPDTGREVRRLTLRAAEGRAEALLARYETAGVAAGSVIDLVTRDGDTGTPVFMYGVSGYGSDGWGGDA